MLASVERLSHRSTYREKQRRWTPSRKSGRPTQPATVVAGTKRRSALTSPALHTCGYQTPVANLCNSRHRYATQDC